MRGFISTAIALATFAALVPCAAAAAPSWTEVSTQTAQAALDGAPPAAGEPFIAAVHLPVPAGPDVSAPPFIIGFVTVGLAQTGVPCFSCVNGAQTSANIGLTAPYNYIATGEVAQYVTAFTNLSNTGSCTFSWAIASGKTKIDAFSYVLKTPGKDGSYSLGFNRNRPVFSGPAVVTAKITCKGSGSQMTTAALYYQ